MAFLAHFLFLLRRYNVSRHDWRWGGLPIWIVVQWPTFKLGEVSRPLRGFVHVVVCADMQGLQLILSKSVQLASFIEFVVCAGVQVLGSGLSRTTQLRHYIELVVCAGVQVLGSVLTRTTQLQHPIEFVVCASVQVLGSVLSRTTQLRHYIEFVVCAGVQVLGSVLTRTTQLQNVNEFVVCAGVQIVVSVLSRRRQLRHFIEFVVCAGVQVLRSLLRKTTQLCHFIEFVVCAGVQVLGSVLSRTMLLSIEVAVEYWLSLTWSPQAQWLCDSTHDSPLRDEVNECLLICLPPNADFRCLWNFPDVPGVYLQVSRKTPKPAHLLLLQNTFIENFYPSFYALYLSQYGTQKAPWGSGEPR